MGKVTGWLKWSFICLLSLMVIISLAMLVLPLYGLLSTEEDDQSGYTRKGIITWSSISIITLFFNILGMVGIFTEKKWILISFTVGLILWCLITLAIEIIGLATIPQMLKFIQNNFRRELSLYYGIEETEILDVIQQNFECCGLNESFVNWNDLIPASCQCDERSTNPCVAAPTNSGLFVDGLGTNTVMIYAKPCLPFISEHFLTMSRAIYGTMLGISSLWALSVVLCVVILCQMSPKEETTTVIYSKEAQADPCASLADAPYIDDD